ncbi:inositol monophosphatase family protein [Paludibacterium purpuratum]|uniref:Myo-inositol-1(Or 4)-monophosphatase n=1 Tax=Paludibacterium purpuratum TaxID=1144873 RepID=A0A4R7B8E9_9NEIS|nr:inositol monophosphatase family protein [Paludibacterium purpuratum]TDR80065.1 myo-inositol-1(or 4)-monophosphatase [Paludibacterium purpuratum]
MTDVNILISDALRGIERIGLDILSPVVMAEKESSELVSNLDLAIDEFLKQALPAIRPIPYISEETIDGVQSAEMEDIRDFWLVDPLDGTVNAVHGLQYFSTSVSLILDNRVEAAAVLNIPTGDIFSATRGGGLVKNGQRVTIRKNPSKIIMATGFAHDKRLHALQIEVMRRVLPKIDDFRRLASPCLDLAFVAEGVLSGSFEFLKAWDFCAGSLFLDEVGLTHNQSGLFHLSELNRQHWFVCGTADMVCLVTNIYDEIRNDPCSA